MNIDMITKLNLMTEITADIKSLKESLGDNPIPFDMSTGSVPPLALIEYAVENYWILQQAIAIAEKYQKYQNNH